MLLDTCAKDRRFRPHPYTRSLPPAGLCPPRTLQRNCNLLARIHPQTIRSLPSRSSRPQRGRPLSGFEQQQSCLGARAAGMGSSLCSANAQRQRHCSTTSPSRRRGSEPKGGWSRGRRGKLAERRRQPVRRVRG